MRFRAVRVRYQSRNLTQARVVPARKLSWSTSTQGRTHHILQEQAGNESSATVLLQRQHAKKKIQTSTTTTATEPHRRHT